MGHRDVGRESRGFWEEVDLQMPWTRVDIL